MSCTLFVNMLKEEFRMHSSLFGSLNFYLFPVLIFGIAFMGTFLIPLSLTVTDAASLSVSVHAAFMMMGMTAGTFGIMGREMMNRRYQDISLLVYSARSLPLSERCIFTIFVLKDTLYYFLLWIMPFSAGFLIAAPAAGYSIVYPLTMFVTAAMSFLTGMCLIFVLSSVYVTHRRLFTAIIICAAVIWLILAYAGGAVSAVSAFLLPSAVFLSFNIFEFAASAAAIVILFIIGILLFSPETSGSEKMYPESLTELVEKLGRYFKFGSVLPAKDLIFLKRSGIGIGQTVFTMIIPAAVIWFVLSLLKGVMTPDQIFMITAAVLGISASTMYTWVTEFDSYSSYYFLPVSVSDILQSKIRVFMLIQIVPVGIIVSLSVIGGAVSSLIPALVMMFSISVYGMSVMVRFSGLYPSVMMYNVRFFAKYAVLLFIPVMFLLGIVNMFQPAAFAALIMLLFAHLFIRSGYRHWNKEDLIQRG